MTVLCINVIRMIDARDPLRYKELRNILHDKKAGLQYQCNAIKTHIDTIDAHLNQIRIEESITSNNTAPLSHKNHGLSPASLSLLSCPECNKSINMEKVQIRDGLLVYGEINCECGYRGL